MNSLSILSPSFTDSVLDVLDRTLVPNFSGFSPFKGGECRLPSVDVRETGTSYIMEVDLPGYTEKDIEINLKDRLMTISSSRKEEKEEKNGEDLMRERSSSEFTRRFTLPQDINSEDVSARFENGVLSIDIPKKPETQPKQIEIKTA